MGLQVMCRAARSRPTDISMPERGSDPDKDRVPRSGIEAKGSMVTLLTGAAMIPAADKANKVGEDAYFISDNGCYFGAPARRLGGSFLLGSGIDTHV